MTNLAPVADTPSDTADPTDIELLDELHIKIDTLREHLADLNTKIDLIANQINWVAGNAYTLYSKYEPMLAQFQSLSPADVLKMVMKGGLNANP